MAERVLVEAGKAEAAKPVRPWSNEAKYRLAGWIGAVLALAALSDYVLTFYPLGLGNAEWEVATISQVIQGLPLLSLGLVGFWMCGAGLGRRWLLLASGTVLLVAAAAVFVLVVLFLLDTPVALRATAAEQVARLGMKKLVARTLFLGLLFGFSYLVMGVLALRQARGGSPKEAVA